MGFPETRVTLIQRLAASGSEEDWRAFMVDYWGPVCRFALRWGAANLDDAEDVAGQTFAALWQNKLLARWMAHRSAKLRTLLCTITRNVLANQRRVRRGRAVRALDVAQRLEHLREANAVKADAFYTAWVEDLLQQAVGAMAIDYYRQGKGDYVRVFYGRLCQHLSVAELADLLNLKPTDVDNYFRHARNQLTERLESALRAWVTRYAREGETKDEFAAEWQEVGAYLSRHGGLEEALQQGFKLLDPLQAEDRKPAALERAMSLLRTAER
jgi:DNA-directed RNA polymerase specialized sigma24 family protein